MSNKPVAERFWEKVDRSNPSGCWLWMAAENGVGYGHFSINGAPQTAHRLAWTFANGEIPAGLEVFHKCDVRLCVNPDHLFLGTHADNMRDMIAKGRADHSNNLRGDKNCSAKMTWPKVAEVRSLWREGKYTSRALGAMFGVSKSTILNIVNNATWAIEARAGEAVAA